MNRVLLILFLSAAPAFAQVFGAGIIRGGVIYSSFSTASSEEAAAFTNDMIACWPLDEASGTREDDYGAFDLTDNNTVAGTTGPVGLGNASLFHAASSEYLSHADDASLRMGNFDTTFVVWVNATAAVLVAPTVLSKNSGGSAGFILYEDRGVDGNFKWTVTDTMAGSATVESDVILPGSGWHFIVCGYDLSNTRIFLSVDNGPDVTAASLTPNGSTATFRIGDREDTAFRGWEGAIAGVAMWNRLLTAGERSSLYANGDGLRACEEPGN